LIGGWREIEKENLIDCYYGTSYGNLSAEVLICSSVHPTDTVFEELKQHAILNNTLIQLRLMITSFLNSIEYLTSNYDLAEDGRVPATPKTLPQVYANVSGLVYDAIVSGRRLIDSIEKAINDVFGKESPEWVYWKGATKTFYDSSLSYALCYDLRNIVEHSFVALSTVNFDYKENVVGFAINLEAGLLQMDRIKPSLKQRLIDFYNERLAANLLPWISVAGTLNSYKSTICALYFEFLLLIKRSLWKWTPTATAKKEIGNYNCIIWRVANDDRYPLYSLDRAYRLQASTLLPLALENDIKMIRTRLLEIEPEKTEALESIERLLLESDELN